MGVGNFCSINFGLRDWIAIDYLLIDGLTTMEFILEIKFLSLLFLHFLLLPQLLPCFGIGLSMLSVDYYLSLLFHFNSII